jgi:hypothetical protein
VQNDRCYAHVSIFIVAFVSLILHFLYQRECVFSFIWRRATFCLTKFPLPPDERSPPAWWPLTCPTNSRLHPFAWNRIWPCMGVKCSLNIWCQQLRGSVSFYDEILHKFVSWLVYICCLCVSLASWGIRQHESSREPLNSFSWNSIFWS